MKPLGLLEQTVSTGQPTVKVDSHFILTASSSFLSRNTEALCVVPKWPSAWHTRKLEKMFAMCHVRIYFTLMLLCLCEIDWQLLGLLSIFGYACEGADIFTVIIYLFVCLYDLDTLYQEWSPEASRSISRKERNSRIDDVTLTNIVSAADEAPQTPQDTIR